MPSIPSSFASSSFSTFGSTSYTQFNPINHKYPPKSLKFRHSNQTNRIDWSNKAAQTENYHSVEIGKAIDKRGALGEALLKRIA
jgi:hypothetical protein